jgi:hypothetical protein
MNSGLNLSPVTYSEGAISCGSGHLDIAVYLNGVYWEEREPHMLGSPVRGGP